MTSGKERREDRDGFVPELGTVNSGSVGLHASAGTAFFAPVTPAAVGRLSRGQQDRVADLQEHALRLEEMTGHLDELVLEARSAGVSWALIGWSVGMSDEGARRRWGSGA